MSPNCVAPLKSKLLISKGRVSLAPLMQQLMRPDSLSLQNNFTTLFFCSSVCSYRTTIIINFIQGSIKLLVTLLQSVKQSVLLEKIRWKFKLLGLSQQNRETTSNNGKGRGKKGEKMTKTLNVAFTPPWPWSTEMFLFGSKLRGNALGEALSLWLRDRTFKEWLKLVQVVFIKYMLCVW